MMNNKMHQSTYHLQFSSRRGSGHTRSPSFFHDDSSSLCKVRVHQCKLIPPPQYRLCIHREMMMQIINLTNHPLYPLPRNLHSYPMIRFAQPSNIPNRAAFYSSSLPIAIVEVFRPSRLFSLPEWLSNRPPRPLC